MLAISEITRRKIIDSLVLNQTKWQGRLNDVEFLSRIYDLSSMPSTDYRYQGAYADIMQHRVFWDDWPTDWIFHDTRFNLLHTDDETFLRFCVELVHPIVRPDVTESLKIVAELNRHLSADGWELIEIEKISGHPVFSATRVGVRHSAVAPVTGWPKVDRQLQEAKNRLDSASTEEQFQAVGLLCREVLISLAQHCYDPSSYGTTGQPQPSKTDAARMLEAIFSKELSGSVNEEARGHGKASLKLALALQHHRSANYRMAALCLEGAASVVNITRILLRDRN